MSHDKTAALIMQRRRQFLVHSFLFYELGEAIIPDADFDRWARELIELQQQFPELSASLPYHAILSGLDTSLSAEALGITRKLYGREIITVALILLQRHKKSRQSFRRFAESYGFSVTNSIERGGTASGGRTRDERRSN